jgi:hypothetical protein
LGNTRKPTQCLANLDVWATYRYRQPLGPCHSTRETVGRVFSNDPITTNHQYAR